jgi:hypothetical protein
MSSERDPAALQMEHFRLLKEFGRNQLAKRLRGDALEELWKTACTSARVPYVSRGDVVEAYKRFTVGQSAESNVALAPDEVAPEFVAVGLTYKKKLFAAHTIRLEPLIFRLLKVYRNNFGTEEEFLRSVRKLADRASKERA